MKKAKIIIGILFLVTVAYSYYKIPQWLIEGTAISNTLAGIILIIDGILLHKNKNVPIIAYQITVSFIMTVYLITTFLTAFNLYNNFSFDDGFMLLHAVNPLVFFTIYLFTTKLKTNNNILCTSCIAPSLIMCYLLFDFIRHQIIGSYVYQIIPNDSNIMLVILFALGTYIFEVLLNFGIIKLKIYTESKIK